MTLTTEELGDTPDVDAVTLDEILQTDAFGAFAILSKTDGEFIQTGNDWQPSEECRDFLQRHDSDPWVLEYRESDQQFRAAGPLTLDQVRQAFRSYLVGDTGWRLGFQWIEIEV
ncbi:MAG: hypothetical protein K2V38_00580 [Gemmataceae bacterium]|nr:hypothetical protein [Gemmataceae bacterium]